MKVIEKEITKVIKIFESEDGEKFDSEYKCLRHEKIMRGDKLCKVLHLRNGRTLCFFASDKDSYEDCIAYVESYYGVNFSFGYPFSDFEGSWLVVVRLTDDGDMYVLRKLESIYMDLEAEKKMIDRDLDTLWRISNEND